jgi:nucleoside-diphosphate-sugar epimerase
MRIFITSASGWIGSAVTRELLAEGHDVVGLARSDASAAAITALGAEVRRGDLTDLDSLRAAADGADGIIHTAFIHDFSAHEDAAAVDFAAVSLFGDLLEGTDKPLVIASGILGAVSVETDRPDPATSWSPRLKTEAALLGFADRGIRSASVRLAPTVHGDGDHGFMATLVGIDREKGSAAYLGDGSSTWPAVHVLDAAHLFRLAVEKAPAGSVLHAIDDEAVRMRDIAEVIGRHLGVPTLSVDPEDAVEHFGWLGRFLAIDSKASSTITRELMGWEPTHPKLLEDLEAGHYFRKA